MRARGNIKADFGTFLFQMKNIRSVFWVPVATVYILIPLILLLTMRKYQDMYYVEESFMLLGQYIVPVLATWWFSFAFIELVENEGNELYYVNSRMKDNLMLLWLGSYLVIIGIGCLAASYWIDIALIEFLRMAICSCFYIALEYAAMYWSGSMTFSFLVIMLYWLATVFGDQIPLEWLNCYSSQFMSAGLFWEKYIGIMCVAIIFYILGCIGNARKEKFN